MRPAAARRHAHSIEQARRHAAAFEANKCEGCGEQRTGHPRYCADCRSLTQIDRFRLGPEQSVMLVSSFLGRCAANGR